MFHLHAEVLVAVPYRPDIIQYKVTHIKRELMRTVAAGKCAVLL